MTITLTREEAQQVLDALVFATPSGYGPTEVYKDSIVLLQNRLAKETPYEVGQRLYRQGLGISDIPTAVYSDSDIAEAYRGFEDARLTQPECVCGEPYTVGVHRQDGPCYQQPDSELKLISTGVTHIYSTGAPDAIQYDKDGNEMAHWKFRSFLPAPEPEPVGWIYEDDEGRMMFSQMPQNPPLWEPVYREKKGG
jgi:hypothetical protein